MPGSPQPTAARTATPTPSRALTVTTASHPVPGGSAEVAVERVSLIAEDGYELAATRYGPHVPKYPKQDASRARLIIAGATGVPQGFYKKFATFAASHGWDTLTLDYRGIGRSAPPSLRGFRMDYRDWARLDLAAAVDAMHAHVGDARLPLCVIGHSFGGHAIGLLPNHARIDAVWTFATGAGWHGWMPALERPRVLALWHGVGPLLTRWKGYLPWSLLGMGEDLPRDVFAQWRTWSSRPRYFFDDPEVGPEVAEAFARVRLPIAAANALDDRWAPPGSRDAFMAGYRNAAVTAIDIDPRAHGLKAVGHMGYFRPEAKPLWEMALAWLDRHATAPGVTGSASTTS